MGIAYQNDELYVDGVQLATLAGEYGTPLYVYSRSRMRELYRRLLRSLAEVDPLIFYAVKANSSAAVINTFALEGAGADVVSGGEIFRAARAGIDTRRMVFAGVAKTVDEIDFALREGILYFTVESEPELERIAARSRALGVNGRIAVRVNPDVDPKTHKYTSTGQKESKFGVDLDRARRVYESASGMPGIEIAGIHMHIGSPVMSIEPYRQALDKVVPVCRELKRSYPEFSHLDVGGGLGVAYGDDESEFDVAGFAGLVIDAARQTGLQVGLEPGRFLTADAGLLLCRVQYIKDNPFRKFVVSDGGMNDLIRPSLYEAYHPVWAVRKKDKMIIGDVVGPVCESSDFFAQERELPAFEAGDLLAVGYAGAYGFAMASSYNSRPRPAEVMVDGEQVELIRRRESWEDLVRGESIPDW